MTTTQSKDMTSIPFPPRAYKELVCGKDLRDLDERFESVGRSLVEMLKKRSMLGSDARILDVGCGCGRVARELTKENISSYQGFDRHDGMIEWCKQEISSRHRKFRFDCFSLKSAYDTVDSCEGTIETETFRFPYEDNAFDTVLLSSVFTHMPFEETAHYLKELSRVLAPNGRVLFSVFFAVAEPYDEGINFYYAPRQLLFAILRSGFKIRFKPALKLFVGRVEADTETHNWFLLEN